MLLFLILVIRWSAQNLTIIWSDSGTFPEIVYNAASVIATKAATHMATAIQSEIRSVTFRSEIRLRDVVTFIVFSTNSVNLLSLFLMVPIIHI